MGIFLFMGIMVFVYIFLTGCLAFIDMISDIYMNLHTRFI